MPAPARTLSPFDAVAFIVGIVIGAGIFKNPSFVAAHAGNETLAMLLWLLGGLISFIGALCYAELTTSYPDEGGDYSFIRRAFGARLAFLFAWARVTVIQTGSIAMLAFIIGDYASAVFSLGGHSSSWYASAVVLFLTMINLAGIGPGKSVQNALTVAIVLGLVAVVGAGWTLTAPPSQPAGAGDFSVPGKAMIFVLLTYGGWNEAAYLSAEVKHAEKNMTRVLFTSIAIVTIIYVAVNLVFLRGLGLAAAARSEAVAADLMRLVMGESGVLLTSLLIVTASMSTMNAVIITGARANYALGRDFNLFGFLGKWRQAGSVPVNALLLQTGVSLGLILMGTVTRSGFSTMVEYTAPVFWFFFLLAGVSLFVLRRNDPHRERPFSVPLYPVTPLVFCLFCIYMLWSSLAYAGAGGVAGLFVLLSGIPALFLALKREKKKISEQDT